ncbi:hypothetical protein BNJ_00298 [Kaumoebavirus]|uniref:hypothetical protein n=1 Tax=Kaumoebavirus TaxID=1859492 RepID=UPI0009C2B47A|nr:hypothetical protein BNJ_00298 [Kaumoebavirus]ARA72120.1 hypothetical protein BNJ_00298 [Kaumoebavirus]
METLIATILNTLRAKLPRDVEYRGEKTINSENDTVDEYWLHFERNGYGGMIHAELLENNKISVVMTDNHSQAFTIHSEEATFDQDFATYVSKVLDRIHTVVVRSDMNNCR